MSSVPTVITSERGKDKLCHEGHLYVFDKLSADKDLEFWRCHFRKDCKVRLHRSVARGRVMYVSGTHSDQPDAASVEIAIRRSNLKRRATETQETPAQLINHAHAGTSLAVQMQFPCYPTLAKVINRARKADSSAPTEPSHRKLIRIPEAYTIYAPQPGQQESFLLADSGYLDQERILIFGRDSARNWLAHVDRIFVDGTFSITPDLFEQTFVILAERSGFVVPLCYALLPNKTFKSYTRMLALLRGRWPLLNPGKISLDFEIGLINAFRNAFPAAEINGCFFHLVKNMQKKIHDLGLWKRYRTEADFALSARMVPALAFVPPAAMENAVSELAPDLPLELMPLLNYFEDNYIGRLRYAPGGGPTRAPPLFPIEWWTVHQRTLDGEPRTNNFAEAAHRKLQREFSVDHPSLWRFIDGIRTVQHSRDVTYAQFVAGNNPPKKRSKYEKADARILKVVSEFEDRNTIEYLAGIAQNYRMESSPTVPQSDQNQAEEEEQANAENQANDEDLEGDDSDYSYGD